MQRNWWQQWKNALAWRHVDMQGINEVIETLKKENAQLRSDCAQLVEDRKIASDKLGRQLAEQAQIINDLTNALTRNPKDSHIDKACAVLEILEAWVKRKNDAAVKIHS